MPNYDALSNKQNELIRKALEGSVFVADILAPGLTTLTQYNASAVAAALTGTANAVNIVTGGNLVLSVDGAAPVSVALLAADAPASVATKITTALGSAGSASIVSGKLKVVATSTGFNSTVAVVSGTGTVLANLGLAVGQKGFGSDAGISLAPLPPGWGDLGWISADGVNYSRDVANSEVTSWGSVTPTRTDVTQDTSSMTVNAQETKLLTIGMATGADLAGVLAAAQTGEVRINKPRRPKSRRYRVLSLAVDLADGGEIYVGRYFPAGKVTNYAEQALSSGDDPIQWGVTLQGEEDSSLGSSESWFFGGPGWLPLLADMGFSQAP